MKHWLFMIMAVFLFMGCSGSDSSSSKDSGTQTEDSNTANTGGNSNTNLLVGNLTNYRMDAVFLVRYTSSGASSGVGDGNLLGISPLFQKSNRTITGDYVFTAAYNYKCLAWFWDDSTNKEIEMEQSVIEGINGTSNYCYFSL